MSGVPRSLPVVIAALVAVVVLVVLGPRSLLVIAAEGPLIAGLLIAASGYGWLITGRLPVAAAQRLVVALCLGLGILSLATLALGVAGWLSRPLAWGVAAGGWAVAAVAFTRRRPAPSPAAQPAAAPPPSPAVVVVDSLLAAAVAASLGVLLFAATLAPGSVWTIEARGYDALEYHLQAPREYYEAGRVHFLPHNVYAQFPQQAEMLYLLLMHLRGGPWAAAIPCQLLHAACAILAVFSLVIWLPDRWPRRVALLLAGTTPWLVVTGSLAYVEGGLLLFAAQAAGLLLRALRERTAGWQVALLSGVCAGLAAGCKYTAVALVAAPLVAGWLLVPGAWSPRARRAAIALAGVLIGFGPWMLRNAAWTHNPLYPLAWHIFDGRGWSDAQNQQWTRAHGLPGATPLNRVATAGRELLGRFASPRAYQPSRFGPAVWLLAALGALAARDRTAAMLAGWLVAVLAVWTFATHIPGRFAIPALIPAIWLAARASGTSGPSATGRLRVALVIVMLALGTGVNLATTRDLLAREQTHWRRAGLDLARLVDATPAFRAAHPASGLPADAKLWIIGDAAVFYVRSPMHYTVVFNRDPWIEYCATRRDDPAACLRWLREHGVDYVAFAWAEIDRLRATYGFSPLVTRSWVAELEQAGLKHVRDEGGWSIYRP